MPGLSEVKGAPGCRSPTERIPFRKWLGRRAVSSSSRTPLWTETLAGGVVAGKGVLVGVGRGMGGGEAVTVPHFWVLL